VVWGINGTGLIVGVALDPTRWDGFELNKKGFVAVDFPGSGFTQATGTIKSNVIVGFYFASRGFQGTDVPGATQTTPHGINGNGDVVGNYVAGGTSHGFLMN
jgi:hypothetical protein